jgi:DNA-binding beta-propeller fold protein YncE
VIPLLLLIVSVAFAAYPIPPLPPYEPVAMKYYPGVSGLVAYNNTNGVAVVNPLDHTISPVLLNEFDYTTIDPDTGEPVGGQLGSESGGRYDVAMTSNGLEALVGNFNDHKVFFIDLSSGTPVVAGMAEIDTFAEDIAIDPTNQWALVTDGGFQPQVAVLHIPTRAWVPAGPDPDDPASYRIVDPGSDPGDPADDVPGYANAVAIARDGRTVVVADYFSGSIHVLLFDPATGGLTFQQTVTLHPYSTDQTADGDVMFRPVNVAISPDGSTVMAISPYRTEMATYPNPEGGDIAMFAIDRPGHVVRHPDVTMPSRVAGAQSAVFSADGRKAYVEALYFDDMPPEPVPLDVFWIYQEIHELTITGPGSASLTRSVRMPTPRGTSQFFGVDTMAITADGHFLYVTNPTMSGSVPVIDVVDLRTFAPIKSIGTPQHYPDPMRDWPYEPGEPEPGVWGDWIEQVMPVGIAFPQPSEDAPRPAIRAVRDDLEALLAQLTDTEDRSLLSDAIAHLQKALETGRWIDDSHLMPGVEGEGVFRETKVAVAMLMELRDGNDSGLPPEVLQSYIDRLVASDRELATIAIAEAQAGGGNAGKIEAANAELSKGDTKAVKNDPDAIEHYKNAWKKAMAA